MDIVASMVINGHRVELAERGGKSVVLVDGEPKAGTLEEVRAQLSAPDGDSLSNKLA